MATKFSVWIDTPNTGLNGNMMTWDTFASDSQRENGFQAGTVASSIRVNTALRSATLITTAIMKSLFDDDESIDASTALDTMVSKWMSQWNSKANRESPQFLGTPTAPTPADNTNTDQIATTKFIKNLITNANPKIAQIQSGSYTGDGTYGLNNPCVISDTTFLGTPKMLIIAGNVYHWGDSNFYTINGGSIVNQTASTSGTSVTTYYATRCLSEPIANGIRVSGAQTTTNIFGSNQFYYSDRVINGELDNPTLVTINTIADIYTTPGTIGPWYYQVKSDYDAGDGECIFTISYMGSLSPFYDMTFVTAYPGNNTTLTTAINGTNVSASFAYTAGWDSSNIYYYVNPTSQTVQVNGFTWYNSSSAAAQLNSNGVTYRWMAIY